MAPSLRNAYIRHALYYANVLAEANTAYVRGGIAQETGLSRADAELAQVNHCLLWLVGAAINPENDVVVLQVAMAVTQIGLLRLTALERTVLFSAAKVAAERLGETRMVIIALGQLGLAAADLGQLNDAAKLQEQSLMLAQEIGDRLLESNALGNLGELVRVQGDLQRSIIYHEQSLMIDHALYHRSGEAETLTNLALAYMDLGDFAQAEAYGEQARSCYQELADRHGEAIEAV